MRSTGGETRRFAQGTLAGGRYQLAEYLGGVGLVELYRGGDRRLNRPVLVTLVPHGRDPVAEQRFHDAIHRLAPLAHPGLVTVHDSGVEDHHGFLVTELVDGEPLSHRLGRQLLSADETAWLGAAVADALGLAHRHGVTHRDINPSNILIGRDGRPRLTGFGLADFTGPPGYDAGAAGDVYSLGLVLLQCATGAVEQPDGSPAPRPPSVPPGLPAPLGPALHAMTEPDPARRPTAAECATILTQPLTDMPADDAPAGGAAGDAGDGVPLRNWAIGSVLFLLLVVLGVLLFGGEPAQPPAAPAPAPAEPAPAEQPPAQPPAFPDLPQLPSVPDVELPDPPAVDVPGLPDIPDVAPDIDGGEVLRRIEDWFAGWV